MKTLLPLILSILSAVCLMTLASCGRVYDAGSANGSAVGFEVGQKAAPTDVSSASSRIRVSVIDVGKGDCILLQADDEAVLIDTGYESTAADVLSCLRDQGVSSLGAMVITHYDRDHIEGIRPIGEAVGVGTIYLPEYEGADKNYRSCIKSVEALGVPIQRVTEELVLPIGNAQLTVFPSGVAYRSGSGKEEGNDNDMSLVATLRNGSDSYLFAGDLEEEGIDAYLAANHGQFNILKMPHHGQHSSNTLEFLDDARPQIALITDAEKDPASKKTLKLLKAADVQTYRTSVDGTVTVESDGSGTYSILT
ncbi:MAG: MBL fold metallo-hydrolase [Atopobiaceae bacterium]|nr:MBL fold metallo-hydrolase [Atopobiaceae bacterium]